MTYAGPIWDHFFKMGKKVHIREMDFYAHLENVSMIFTDSYVGGVQIGEMDLFVILEIWTWLRKRQR